MDISTAVELNKINLNHYSRYIEVIVGSGKSLKGFMPEISCLLNDSNTDLINFYNYLQDPELFAELSNFSRNWKILARFSAFSSEEIFMAFQDFDKGIISAEDVGFMIRAILIMNMNHDEFIPLFEKTFVVSIDMLTNTLIQSIVNKLLQLKGDKINSESVCFNQHIETTFCAGFYKHFRSLINLQKTDIVDCISLSKHFASWYFLKEYGKGHHLQYDQNGNLKNHYGGADYNRMDFAPLIEEVCNSEFTTLINKATLHNSIPAEFLKEIDAGTNDIVVANLLEDNVILANGKNYSSMRSIIDQIKQIVNYNTNLLILCDEEQIALEFEETAQGKLTVVKNGTIFSLTNFSK